MVVTIVQWLHRTLVMALPMLRRGLEVVGLIIIIIIIIVTSSSCLHVLMQEKDKLKLNESGISSAVDCTHVAHSVARHRRCGNLPQQKRSIICKHAAGIWLYWSGHWCRCTVAGIHTWQYNISQLCFTTDNCAAPATCWTGHSSIFCIKTGSLLFDFTSIGIRDHAIKHVNHSIKVMGGIREISDIVITNKETHISCIVWPQNALQQTKWETTQMSRDSG